MQLDDPILNLRHECAEDEDFLATLYRSTRDDLSRLNLPRAMLDNLIGMQFRAQQAGHRSRFPGARHRILEKAGQPIGCMLVHHGVDAIRLVYLALLPHERRRGHGRRLIAALQSEAARANRALTLAVSPHNVAAQRLYLSCGFSMEASDGASLEMRWTSPAHAGGPA